MRRARGKRLRQVALALAALRELDDCAGEIGLRRDKVEVLECRVPRELCEGRAVEQVVARGAVRAHAEAGRCIRLRIEIDHKRALAGLSETRSEIDRGRRLPDAALLVRQGVDASHVGIVATAPDRG